MLHVMFLELDPGIYYVVIFQQNSSLYFDHSNNCRL